MYKHILVPLDGSELSSHVLPHVENMARARIKPRVTLLMVVEPVTMAFGTEALSVAAVQQLQEMQQLKKVDDRKYLGKIARGLKKFEIKADTVQSEGLAADEIIDYVNRNKVDLVIMSTHGRSGFSRAIFGSVAEKVLRGVCTPVMMIRAPGCGLLFKKK